MHRFAAAGPVAGWPAVQEDGVCMDENMVKFHEKLKELLQYAKNKKNVLEYDEINDFFADLEIDANQMEKIYDYLE